MYKGHVQLATFGTASDQYEFLRSHLSGLYVKLLETENLMTSLRDNIRVL
jgi:hypothetical protein